MSSLLAGNLISELTSWGIPSAAALSFTYVTHRLLVVYLTFVAVFSKKRVRRANAMKALGLLTRTPSKKDSKKR
jgi:hypothetical protein